MMKIGIIGAGSMGSALGTIWAKQGHQVTFSYSRDPAKLQSIATAAGETAQVGTPEQAVQLSDVILIALQPFVLEEVLSTVGSLENKIVLTCMSGLKPDFTRQTIGINTDLKVSVAEQLAELAPGAKVVEAFNITFAEILASDSRQFGSEHPTVFYCGDDPEAKEIVAHLIQDCGYDAIDVGGLIVARSLETLATAWVQFAVASNLFPNIGIKALRR
ncbi:NADPH-dependent F420 reductase [Leptolyngbya sp. FACHB-671]|uniref:NADPH-dependent F420 reductase n=1 Tax=Leptolyngbya sp. FACHB-671 TaxID=2692812 RepID=UPI001683F2B6|nr:NADPH-dependent F420 reductase [Leptolyngbya sp. FACHB-671]MBD2071692.1 NADPH-dependent F420 reductase [Leptolyngbya sp. FACHB-671]